MMRINSYYKIVDEVAALLKYGDEVVSISKGLNYGQLITI